jgi:acetyl esterase/lipase
MLTTDEAMRRPQPVADRRIHYGSAPLQFGDLRMPRGEGEFPLAIVIHGGCWSAEYDLSYMGMLCAALAAQGIATWCVEYRRVGDTGGGWPGTFVDVGAAADFVRRLAREFPLDLDRVVAVGHSAGGHLALWLAARSKMNASDDLYVANPIALRGVVALAAIPDLVRAARENVCGDMSIRLMGGTHSDCPDRYRQGSPVELLPLGVKQVLVHGEADALVPPSFSAEYTQRARTAGDLARFVSVTAGHFELISPSSQAGSAVESAVLSLLK